MAQDEPTHASSRRENRLAGASSPYLLQHADNPVDWYPWGEEAFDRARKEDKPVFLSIGYSTCHWCHVMERESFEDPEVARLMNETFVCIKVDREERPDVDGIYMTACRIMTGGGGWPLTLFLTPEGKPFFAATYIPKENRFGRTGLLELIPRVKETWKERRPEIEGAADRIRDVLADVAAGGKAAAEGAPGDEAALLLDHAFDQLRRHFDREHGGFGTAPKFPSPHNLSFLLRMHRRTGDATALDMAVRTLEAMRRGGIYDHVGFGFHRYAVDREWRVPHFEKMLYDQAGLSTVYLEAYQVTGKDAFADTAREIFTYVLRDLRAPEGGFFSAEDADSEGEEGKFYLWTTEEIRRVLDEEEAELVIELFHVEPEGNLEAIDPSAAGKGTNVLYSTAPLEEAARRKGMEPAGVEERLAAARVRLLRVRGERIRPGRDDKILADWNGLMIGALARGARVLDDRDLLAAAEKAASFVLEKMTDTEGRLLHRYHHGKAGILGFLDDYAFMVHGLIDLYEADLDARRLETALRLQEEAMKLFRDPRGGFFLTAEGAETPLVRRKQVEDGAVPSGNSVTLSNLLRLARLTGSPDLEEEALRLVRAFLPEVDRYPSAHTAFLCGVDFFLASGREVVLVGRRGEERFEAFRALTARAFLPHTVVLFKSAGEKEGEVERLAPFVKDMTLPKGSSAAAYVCSGFTCQAPVTTPQALEAALGIRRDP